MLDLTKESSLLEPVAGYIKRKGFHVQCTELPFYQRSVDIYGFSRIKDKTIAIELKLHKWKKAFQQALIYQLCADETYIAMPQKYAFRADFDLLSEHGIGLISVSGIGRCVKLIEARQSSVVKSDYKKSHIAFLQGLTNE